VFPQVETNKFHQRGTTRDLSLEQKQLGGGNSNIFLLSPLFGEDFHPFLTCAYFSGGLVQPPTRQLFEKTTGKVHEAELEGTPLHVACRTLDGGATWIPNFTQNDLFSHNHGSVANYPK